MQAPPTHAWPKIQLESQFLERLAWRYFMQTPISTHELNRNLCKIPLVMLCMLTMNRISSWCIAFRVEIPNAFHGALMTSRYSSPSMFTFMTMAPWWFILRLKRTREIINVRRQITLDECQQSGIIKLMVSLLVPTSCISHMSFSMKVSISLFLLLFLPSSHNLKKLTQYQLTNDQLLWPS